MSCSPSLLIEGWTAISRSIRRGVHWLIVSWQSGGMYNNDSQWSDTAYFSGSGLEILCSPSYGTPSELSCRIQVKGIDIHHQTCMSLRFLHRSSPLWRVAVMMFRHWEHCYQAMRTEFPSEILEGSNRSISMWRTHLEIISGAYLHDTMGICVIMNNTFFPRGPH